MRICLYETFLHEILDFAIERVIGLPVYSNRLHRSYQSPELMPTANCVQGFVCVWWGWGGVCVWGVCVCVWGVWGCVCLGLSLNDVKVRCERACESLALSHKGIVMSWM